MREELEADRRRLECSQQVASPAGRAFTTPALATEPPHRAVEKRVRGSVVISVRC